MKGEKKLGGGRASRSKKITATMQSKAAKQRNADERGGVKKGFRR